MGVVVDSSVFIAAERGGGQSVPRFPDSAGDAYVSAVTVSELLVGVHRANSAAHRARRQSFVEAILAALPVLQVDAEVARVHARLMAEQLAVGRHTAAHDLWIAATAMAAGFTVLTRDVDDFSRVPGLTVLDAR